MAQSLYKTGYCLEGATEVENLEDCKTKANKAGMKYMPWNAGYNTGTDMKHKGKGCATTATQRPNKHPAAREKINT